MIGIIFDCDGTLVDSEKAHFLSWQKALENRGSSLSAEEYSCLAGNPGAYISQKLHEKANVDSPEAILRDKTEFFRQLHKKGIPPIARTISFVRELSELKQKLNIKLAVASAAPKDEILTNLAHAGILDLFDTVVSGKDDLSEYDDPEGVNKPKPYIYLHAAKILGLEPSGCVAFEDSHAGVVSASSAGLLTYAVPNAFTDKQDFSKAHFVIDSSSPIDKEEFFQRIREMTQKEAPIAS